MELPREVGRDRLCDDVSPRQPDVARSCEERACTLELHRPLKLREEQLHPEYTVRRRVSPRYVVEVGSDVEVRLRADEIVARRNGNHAGPNVEELLGPAHLLAGRQQSAEQVAPGPR